MYETIKDVYEGVKNGDIDESELEIIIDNDDTGFYTTAFGDDSGTPLLRGNGYSDVKELYELLFPNAVVEWC